MIVFERGDERSEHTARVVFDEIMALTIGLGGTISGEHGIGRLKQPWLGHQLGEGAMAITRAIKAALDPHGILNPGVITGGAGDAAGAITP